MKAELQTTSNSSGFRTCSRAFHASTFLSPLTSAAFVPSRHLGPLKAAAAAQFLLLPEAASLP